MTAPLLRLHIVLTLAFLFALSPCGSYGQDGSTSGPFNAFYLWNNDPGGSPGLYVGVLSAAHGIAAIQLHDHRQGGCEFETNAFSTLYCISASNSFFSYNTTTGDETVINVGGSDPGAGFGDWFGMATDPTTGQVYAVSSTSGFGALWTVDLNTGFVNFVGFSQPLHGIAFDLSGQLYGLNAIGTDSLYQVDKSIGTPTFVGETGVDADFADISMDLDEDDGTIYAAGDIFISGIGSANRLMTVNPATGAFNAVSDIGTQDDIVGPIAIAATNRNLPVELVSFEAVVDAGFVVLTWRTASEENNAGFEIEMAGDAQPTTDEPLLDWASVGFVDGWGSTNDPQSYTYRLTDLAPGLYRFRLKQIDFDGAFEYSHEVDALIGAPSAIALESPYPNPFSTRTSIQFSVDAEQTVRMTLVDALGRRVRTLYRGRVPAHQTQTVDLDGRNLPSGVYAVILEGAGISEMARLVVQ